MFRAKDENNVDRPVVDDDPILERIKRSQYDPFGVLGISREASFTEVKTQYKSLARTYHPDKHANNQSYAAIFSQINTAYKKIKTELEVEELSKQLIQAQERRETQLSDLRCQIAEMKKEFERKQSDLACADIHMRTELSSLDLSAT